jgi:hypothetical protein
MTAPFRANFRHALAGTASYVTTPDLMLAVNAAIAPGHPPADQRGTGCRENMLTEEVATALGMPLL